MEIRNHPRLRVHLAAEVVTDSHATEVTITNMSKSGLQLECGQDLIEAMMPDIKHPSPNKAIHIKVNVDLKQKTKGKSPVSMACAIIYSRRLSQKTHVLGCTFNDTGSKGKKQLLNFLQHAQTV